MATVVLGDLNTSASSAATTELSQRGLTDSYASMHADAAATHRFEILGLSIGTRMDFIFHSWQLRTIESQLLPGEPSDHDIVVSTVEWAEATR